MIQKRVYFYVMLLFNASMISSHIIRLDLKKFWYPRRMKIVYELKNFYDKSEKWKECIKKKNEPEYTPDDEKYIDKHDKPKKDDKLACLIDYVKYVKAFENLCALLFKVEEIKIKQIDKDSLDKFPKQPSDLTSEKMVQSIDEYKTWLTKKLELMINKKPYKGKGKVEFQISYFKDNKETKALEEKSSNTKKIHLNCIIDSELVEIDAKNTQPKIWEHGASFKFELDDDDDIKNYDKRLECFIRNSKNDNFFDIEVKKKTNENMILI